MIFFRIYFTILLNILLCFGLIKSDRDDKILKASNVMCGGTISIKRSNIVNPTYVPTSCSYTIRASSPRVCQLRLDFKSFSLAQPTIEPYPQCTLDVFSVGNVRLCGQNSGQHIYIPFNFTGGVKYISLSFLIGSRQLNPGLTSPSWNIQITQLECPYGSPLTSYVSETVMNNIGNIVQIDEMVSGRNLATRTIINDGYWIAPPGCLQYYPDPNGIFESFNYNNGLGPYIGDMNYAICFKKSASTQQINYNTLTFQLGYGAITSFNEGYGEACYSEIESPGRSEDYLSIPEAKRSGTPLVRSSKYCASSLANTIVTSTTPGPFIVYFNSDNIYDPQTKPEIGYKISYQVI